jgi:hypothetical protein
MRALMIAQLKLIRTVPGAKKKPQCAAIGSKGIPND